MGRGGKSLRSGSELRLGRIKNRKIAKIKWDEQKNKLKNKLNIIPIIQLIN